MKTLAHQGFTDHGLATHMMNSKRTIMGQEVPLSMREDIGGKHNDEDQFHGCV